MHPFGMAAYAAYKKQAEQGEEEDKTLDEQLLKLGLETRDVAADGNCLFRAVSDQLRGTDEFHKQYRQTTCLYTEF